MTMRKIKLNGKVKEIDVSDGKGLIPFGMSGAGSMQIKIDGELLGYYCYCENTNMLDGDVEFTHKREVINNTFIDTLLINDDRYNELKKIHTLSWEDIRNMDETFRINTILWGLKYEDIQYINEGYRFGKELTFNNFCICFNSEKAVVFKSSHKGFIAPDYLSIDKFHSQFIELCSVIKKTINKYFDIEQTTLEKKDEVVNDENTTSKS
jgi:hypothetical protein